MSPSAAQSLAAALAAFIAVTPFAGDIDKTPTDPKNNTRAMSATRHAGLTGVGMPNTGPGNVPLKPLTVIVNITGADSKKVMRGDMAQLGDWLGTHHGRARMAVVSGTRSTALVDPSKIGATPMNRTIRSLPSFERRTFAGHSGQRLLVTVGSQEPPRPPGAASLWLPTTSDAPVVDVVALADHEAVRQPVDGRRPGVIAATTARAVISLARLHEIPNGSTR